MKLKQFSYLFLILSLLFISVSLYSQTVNKDFFDGEIYVKYNDDFAVDFSNQFVEPQSLAGLNEELVKEYGITQAHFSFNKIPDIKLQRTVRIKFNAIEKADDLLKYFEQLHYIDYAEKIPIVRPTYTPNDFGQNKNGDVWHLHKIKATKAWDYTKGDTNITVAVVDQEVDINHPDLKDNIWTNPNEIPNNGIDDDNNGYIDDIHGWDVSDNDNNPTNSYNINLDHGTPCAGLVSATTDNSLGIASIGFKVKIIAVKASPDNNFTKLSIPNAYNGIIYAAQAKADIISCSFGGSNGGQTSQNIITFAINQGSIVIASAGNDNFSNPHYPAAFPNVISVTASEINDKKASFSNYGSWIDVSTPGVSVKTTFKNNTYISFGGTSAACPITAGLLGLMKSHMPTISNNDLKQCLINSTDNIEDLNPSYKGQLGSGRLNAENALQCVDSVKKSPPTLNVSINKNYICPLEKITLSAASYKRPLDSLVWYLFKENTIEKLNGQQIETSFTKDSIYSISAVGYDKYGKDSIHQSNYIHVNSSYSRIFFFEDFESSNQNYSIVNPNNNLTWENATASKTNNSSNSALKMNFYDSKVVGQRDAVIFPPIDLTIATNPKLTFQYSYHEEGQLKNDSLNIYVSTDSGKTFPYKVFTKSLFDIYTASNKTNWSFKPDENSEWCISHWFNRCKAIDLIAFSGAKNITLKFEAYYGGGNNLYLDDIKVFTNCGEFISEKPSSSFTATKTIACLEDSLQFLATSSSFPEIYQWVFEGGISDSTNSANPKVLYKDAGSFDVTLVSSNVLGADTLVLRDYITVVAPPKIAVSDTQQYVCPNDSVFFTAWGTDSIVWLNINTSKITIDSVLGDRPVQNTFYQAKAITKEGCFDTTTVKAILVPLPPSVSINQRLDSLDAVHNTGNFIYRWYFNDTIDGTRTTKSIRPYKTGNYKVEIIDSAGCTSISNSILISTVGIKELPISNIKLYPNPVKKLLSINGLPTSIATSISITDILGREVFTAIAKSETEIVDVSSYSKGLYLIKVTQGEQSITKKIIVE